MLPPHFALLLGVTLVIATFSGRARAQSNTDDPYAAFRSEAVRLASPPTHSSLAPARRYTLTPATESASFLTAPRLRRDPLGVTGWGWLGAELGGFVAFAGMGLLLAADQDELAVAIALTAPFALSALGANLMSTFARNNNLSGLDGAAAAGTMPGATAGFLVAASLATGLSERRDGAANALIYTGGAAIGAVVGYFLFRELAKAGGDPGWIQAAYWTGLLVGFATGLPLAYGRTNEARAGYPLLMLGAASIFATIAHFSFSI